MRHVLLTSGALLAGLFAATGALAQQVDFEGTRENVNPLSPPGSGRCSPPNFNTVTIAPGNLSSTGTSNIGTFTSTQSHCIVTAPPTDLVDGEFTYTFAAGDTIFGTYTGRTDPSGTPGQFVATENLVITGGTGRFAGATGTIDSTGALRFANGNGVFEGTLAGSIVTVATTQNGDFALALGQGVAAQGDFATAVGGLAIANAERATAVGSGAQATGFGSSAIGDRTVASATATTAVGQQAQASGVAGTALGHNTRATGLASTAVGVSAQATQLGATALGRLSAATGERSLAAGNFAQASALGTTALGDQTVANGMAATALGQQAEATGVASTALGHNSRATGVAATAVGVSAQATQLGATAVGRLASATFAGSTAIGATATTTAANQVALGGAGSSVRIGDIAASTAAQVGPVSVATVDANGTIGRDTTLYSRIASIEALNLAQTGAIDNLNNRVSVLFDLREEDRRDMRQGIAAATAMGHAPFPSEPGRTSYVLNGATFRGEQAVGGSLMHRLKSDVPIAIGVGFSFAGNKNNAFRAGVAGEF